MSNGVALAHFPQAASTPASAKDVTPILERKIGEVTAKAAVMLGQVWLEFEAGHLTPTTKTAGADLIAELYELQEATIGQLDFNAAVRIEGMAVLWERHGADFRYFKADQMKLDVALHELLGHVLTVVARVTKFEREMN